jgi:hypothetical protein
VKTLQYLQSMECACTGQVSHFVFFRQSSYSPSIIVFIPISPL